MDVKKSQRIGRLLSIQGVGAVDGAVLGERGGRWVPGEDPCPRGGRTGKSGRAACCLPALPRRRPTLALSRWLCSLATEFIPKSHLPPPPRERFSQCLTWIFLAEIKVINLYPLYWCQWGQTSPSSMYAPFKAAAWSCTTALIRQQ